MKDIFGREVQVGDYVAAGMNLDRSSVLRIGQVVNINQTRDTYSKQLTGRESVRIRWRNDSPEGKKRYRSVKDSNILCDPSYLYAKVVILDPDFVKQFEPDIEDFREL
jgi:hypothetical protein